MKDIPDTPSGQWQALRKGRKSHSHANVIVIVFWFYRKVCVIHLRTTVRTNFIPIFYFFERGQVMGFSQVGTTYRQPVDDLRIAFQLKTTCKRTAVRGSLRLAALLP